MAYIAEFKTIKDDSVKVEIYGAGDGVLTLSGSSPVTIEYDSDDLFKPLKQSICNISVISEQPLLDLYTGKINDITCKIFTKAKGSSSYKLLWFGFLTPNVYSQDYNAGYNKFNLEFIDIIAQLENIKFSSINGQEIKIDGMWFDGTNWNYGDPPEGFIKQEDILKPGWNYLPPSVTTTSVHYLTFYEYFIDGLKFLDKTGLIKSIFVQDDVLVNIKECGCKTRNYIDESGDADDGSMTYKEVLESIVGYLGCSMIYYGDSLYLINPLTLNMASLQEFQIADTKSTNTINTRLQYLRNIGVCKASAKIELGNIYNKITLVASNNPIGNIIPDPLDDKYIQPLTSVNGLPYIIDSYKIIQGDETNNFALLSAYCKNTKFIEPIYGFGDINEPEAKYRTVNAAIQRYVSYSTDEPEPSSLNWSKCITWQLQHQMKSAYESPTINSWTIQPFSYTSSSDNYFTGKGGYILISFKYMVSEANGVKVNSKHNYIQEGTDDWYRNPEPYGHPHDCVIHNKYDYNWATGKVAKNENSSRWNYLKKTYPDFIREEEIKESHKLWLQIGNKVWDGQNWLDYSVSYSGFTAYTTQTYDDQVVGKDKTPDNAVSYKLGLAEPMDGIMIPLPENIILQGNITFKIYPVNFFGVQLGSENGGVPLEFIAMGRQFTASAEFLKELKITYTTSTEVKDIFNLDTYDPDVVYTNVIDDNNVVEFDDLELTTNTYTPYACSHSYVMKKNANGDFIYVENVNGMKQEERIITKYSNYYSQPRLVYSNNINNVNNTSITPFSSIKIESLNKSMVVDSLELDLQNNIANVNLRELV